MTGEDDVRAMWARFRDEVDGIAQASKQSHAAVLELSRRYRLLDPQERAVVDELLAEWVESEDETMRFDALALVDAHGIRSAVPALRRLAARLEESTAPGAPYEWAKVNRVIALLGTGEEGSRASTPHP